MSKQSGGPLRLLLSLLLLAGLCASSPLSAAVPGAAGSYRDHDFDYFVSGEPHAPRARQTRFLLALMGGGGRVDSAFAALASAAGGGRIVILRAVADDSYDPTDGDYGESFTSKWGPVACAQTIVFHNRVASYDARVLAILRNADGIFIAGGDQANYLRYWKGTPVQAALNRHVAANRPLGGSSAGLAILGHYSYTALDGGSLESKVALADAGYAGVTLENDFLHFRWLEHTITDSHFSARARLGRLLVFLAHIQAQWGESRAFGVGIDERSALLIAADGLARLAPGSAGSAWFVSEPTAAEPPLPGRPLSVTDVQVVRLGPDSTLDFVHGRALQAAAETTLSVHAGVPLADPGLRGMLSRDVVPPDED